MSLPILARMAHLAKAALEAAQLSAGRLHAAAVTPDHILLALMESGGYAPWFLDTRQLADEIKRRAEARIGQLARTESPSRRPPLDGGAEFLIERAGVEAAARGDAYIRTDHFLIAMFAMTGTAIHADLVALGISTAEIELAIPGRPYSPPGDATTPIVMKV